MTKLTFQDITDTERQWIESQLAAARSFVAQHASEQQVLSLEVLDAAWSAWMATAATELNDINNAINCVGIPFGSLLVETGEFEWCVSTDDWGTDLAVRALPGSGDVVVYPADFVSKRWETRTTDFLADAFPQILDHVSKIRNDWAGTTRNG